MVEDYYPKMKYLKIVEPENTKAEDILAAIGQTFLNLTLLITAENCRLLFRWCICYYRGNKRCYSAEENKIYEPRHEITNNVVCATSKASDQPAHTGSLIRAFASH